MASFKQPYQGDPDDPSKIGYETLRRCPWGHLFGHRKNYREDLRHHSEKGETRRRLH